MKPALILVFLVCVCNASYPGLNLAINKLGIENLKTHLLPLALARVTDLSIPDFSTSVGSSFLKIKFKFEDIDLTSFKLSLKDTTVTTTPSHEIKLKTKNLKAKGKCKFDFDSSIGDGDGKAELSISDTDVTIDFKVYSLGGVLNIQSVSADVDIDNLDVDIDGDIADKILDWLEDVFDSDVKDAIEDALEDKIEDELTDYLNGLFSQYGPIYTYYGALGIDYFMVTDPLIDTDWIGLRTLGEVFDAYNYNMPPFSPPSSLNVYNSAGRELQVYLSSYSINTMLYALYSYNIFQGNFTSEIIPDSSPLKLTTSGLELLFPGLVQKYGEDLPIDVIFNLSNYTHIENYGQNKTVAPYFTLDAPVYISLSVRGQATPPVMYQSEILINATWALQNWRFYGEMNSFYLSKLDTLSYLLPNPTGSEFIRQAINTVISQILPELNAKYMNQGITLPELPYVNLTDSSIYIKNGCLYMDANPVFLLDELEEETILVTTNI